MISACARLWAPAADLTVSGPAPKHAYGKVEVCWRSTRHKRLLGAECDRRVRVLHGRLRVSFHLGKQARQGTVTVSVKDGNGHKVLKRVRVLRT